MALPLLVVVLLGVAQVVVVAVHQIALVNAARDAVRAASVSAEPDTAARAAAARLMPEADCAASVEGNTVTVTLTSQDGTDVPLIGAVIPTVDLTSHATMTLEPP